MGSVVQRSGVQDLGRTVEFKLYKYRAASCNHHRVRSQIPNSDLQFPLVRLLVLNSFGRRAWLQMREQLQHDVRRVATCGTQIVA